MQLRAERREESWMSNGPTARDLPSIDEVLATLLLLFGLTRRSFHFMSRPVDAAHDSKILARLLEEGCDKILPGS
jgi:hypothetical protein